MKISHLRTHRFMQDNNPKLTSQLEKSLFDYYSMTWWWTPPPSPPPESLDCNPIEKIWHELQDFIRREIKPTNKQELVKWHSEFLDNC